jgi:alpha-tubulin suppressor-like RCC1 family protein
MLSLGKEGSCGITTGSSFGAFCWGDFNPDWVSGPKIPSTTVPTRVRSQANADFVRIAGQFAHLCAIVSNGAAHCWGRADSGQLGNGGTVSSATPVAVSGGNFFSQVAAGMFHSCGLATTRLAYCWGSNSHGQRADPLTVGLSSVPVAIVGSMTFDSLTTGYLHTCGLLFSTHLAYCWGANESGQIGDGSNTDRYSPTPVAGGMAFVAISAGGYTTCGLTASGSVYCWGSNANGQIGDGTTTNRNSPTLVNGTFDRISVGDGITCARSKTGSRPYCWDSATGGVPALLWP